MRFIGVAMHGFAWGSGLGSIRLTIMFSLQLSKRGCWVDLKRICLMQKPCDLRERRRRKVLNCNI